MITETVQIFIESTVKVLKTMAFTNVKTGEPYLKKDEAAKGDVSSILSLIGNKNGTMSVSFSERSILPIVSNMLGEKYIELNKDICDAVGELTNIIAGQARAKLDELGISLKACIPTVVMGKNHVISHVTQHGIVAVPFSTKDGDFTIEVCFDK